MSIPVDKKSSAKSGGKTPKICEMGVLSQAVNLALVAPMGVVYAGVMRSCIYIILLTMACVSTASADIYRWKDAQGNVFYSDEPQPGAEKVEVSEPTIVPSGPTEFTPNRKADSNAAVDYDVVTITSPADNTTIRQNVVDIRVSISVTPALQTKYGHQLQLLHDGNAVEAPGRRLSFQLGDVDRGAHTLQAVIVDKNGRAIKRSQTTTYFVHKQTAQRRAP